jgi:cell division transport system permease protein
VLVIGNTIRLAILNCQSEIKIMKLVGATDRFIRRPFLYTGFWYGLLGGFFAWCTILFAMSVLAAPISILTTQYASDYQLRWFARQLFLYLPLTGLLIGVLGAWIAVGRHLDAIEPN